MWCVPLCLHGLWFGIPCEASARSREADSDQVRYRFNGLGRGVPSHGGTSSYGSLCSGTKIVREPWLLLLPTDGAKSVEAFSCLGRSQEGLHLEEGKKTTGSGRIPAKLERNQGGPVEEPGRTLRCLSQ
ncbi:hypothetical protein Taro_006802 [Colocasia esculenta]|uniref:Uncharacterized protein n=1 Tax=Colocasia esculenta TaxID=4460 RepID=A0A843TS61_COLES|nr:hypothetical protein [Colocasia esculenta]